MRCDITIKKAGETVKLTAHSDNGRMYLAEFISCEDGTTYTVNRTYVRSTIKHARSMGLGVR